jgi:hypothetical protein
MLKTKTYKMVDINRLNVSIEKLKNFDEIRFMQDQDFKNTKDKFQHIINSKRQYEKIKNIQDLLTILVCRGLSTCINDIGQALSHFLTEEHRKELWNDFKELKNHHNKQNMYSKYKDFDLE